MELLSGTAHLKRGGRNPTAGAKNRARSLTETRNFSLLHFVHSNLQFLLFRGQVLLGFGM